MTGYVALEAHMPSHADECRLNAARCLKLAHHASSPEDREAEAVMAETWRRLAAQIECDASLLHALSELEVGAASPLMRCPRL
jgi:hypothetical protein